MSNRKWGYRSYKFDSVNKLMDSFVKEARELVDTVESNGTGFKEKDLEANTRGTHWTSIMGYDRNSKKVSLNFNY